MTETLPLSLEQQGLVRRHLYLVQEALRQLCRRTGRGPHDRDLMAAGNVGLTEAASRYDRSLSKHFSEYAKPRIRGAMLSALAKELRAHKRVILLAKLAGYQAAAEAEFAGNPLTDTDEDARARLDLYANGVLAAMAAALGGQVARMAGEAGMIARLEHARMITAVKDGMKTLPRTEHVVLDMLYFAGQTYEAVSRALAISVGEVRWAEKKGLRALGQSLKKRPAV